MANQPVTKRFGKNLRSLAADFLLVGILIYLYFFGATQFDLFANTNLIISGVVIGSLVVLWLVVGHHFIPRDLLYPLGAFLVALGLATALSIDPRRSMIELWLLIIEMSLFLLFTGLASRMYSPQRVVGAALIAGCLLMVLSWSQVLQWYLSWLQSNPGQWIPAESYRLPAPNFLATILNVWLMFTLARLWWTRNAREKVALILFSLSALALIYLTSSREGWIGTVAGLGSLWLVSLRLNPAFWKARWQRVTRSWLTRLALVASVLVLAAGFVTILLLQSTRPGHSPFLLARGYLWQPALNAFLRSPVWGSGPFTFISFYLQVNSVPPGIYFDYAHNIYLDLLGGTGLLGLISFLWLAWMVLRKFIRGLGQFQGSDLAVLTGALAASAAFLVHGLFDSVQHTVPTSAWNLAILLGASSAVVLKKSTHASRWQILSVAGLGFLAAAGFFVNAWLNQPMQAGVQAGASGNWNLAAQHFEQATQRDPHLAVTYQQLGLAYAQLYLQGEPSALVKAKTAFEQAARLDPYWILNYGNLGQVRQELGDLPGALDAYRRAAADAPESYEGQWLLGMGQEAAGDLPAARQSYQAALKTCPACACYSFWNETPLRKEVTANVECKQPLQPEVSWNPGYLAYMFRRPSLDFDWALVSEKGTPPGK